MQDNNLEMMKNIPQEMWPIIRDVAKSISDFGDKSGQKLSALNDIFFVDQEKIRKK